MTCFIMTPAMPSHVSADSFRRRPHDEKRYGPSRAWKRKGRTQHGNGSEAPLVRIVTECACGHGSNRVMGLAYNVNRAKTGDWPGG
jgi:hypothetical protein